MIDGTVSTIAPISAAAVSSSSRTVLLAKEAKHPIEASRQLSAPPDLVLKFLTNLDNHALLAPGLVRVLSYDREEGLNSRALVRLRGPLGMHRTASTELLRITASSITGRAKIGETTVASIVWTIQALHTGSFVTLCASVDAASPLDSLLLRFGARRWLLRRFAGALEQLSQELGTVSARSAQHSGADRRDSPLGRGWGAEPRRSSRGVSWRNAPRRETRGAGAPELSERDGHRWSGASDTPARSARSD